MPLMSMGKAAYKRGDGPVIPLVNLFYENDPRNLEDQTSLIQKPGESEFADLGDGPRRGVFRQAGVLDGDFIVCSGEKLYRITPAGVSTELGDLPGTALVSIAGNGSAVYVATGAGLYVTNGTTVSSVTFPDSAGVVAVAYLNGFFVFVRAASHRVYWLNPGETVIDALDFISAEISPDDLVSIISVGDELVLPGGNSLEAWSPTTDPNAPFQRITGRLFPIGCSSFGSISQAGGSVLFVGEDRYGGGRKAYRLDTTPAPISEPWVDERLRKADAEDFVSWTFGIDSHTFWALNTGTETLVYDLSTGIWTTFKSHGIGEWRCSLGAPRGDGLIVAGDSQSGKLWLLDPALNQDDGEPMERLWPARMQLKAPLRCFNVIPEITVGFAPITNPDDDPMIAMRFSEDLAQTWSDWELVSLGRQGEYNTVPAWLDIGLIGRPGADFQFRVTDNVRITPRQIEYNGSLR